LILRKILNFFNKNKIILKCVKCGFEIKILNPSEKNFIPPLCPRCGSKMKSNDPKILF